MVYCEPDAARGRDTAGGVRCWAGYTGLYLNNTCIQTETVLSENLNSKDRGSKFRDFTSAYIPQLLVFVIKRPLEFQLTAEVSSSVCGDVWKPNRRSIQHALGCFPKLAVLIRL